MDISGQVHYTIARLAMALTDFYYDAEAKENAYENFKRDIEYICSFELELWEHKLIIDALNTGSSLRSKYIINT